LERQKQILFKRLLALTMQNKIGNFAQKLNRFFDFGKRGNAVSMSARVINDLKQVFGYAKVEIMAVSIYY
jgi:hypothetical protein